MGTKNQSMATKRANRKKVKRGSKPAKVVKVLPRKNGPTEAQLEYELATKGIVATAQKYRGLVKNKDRNAEPPKNVEIVKGMLDAINLLAPIHSSIEIADVLAAEGKFSFTAEELAKINNFDEYLVKIAEDMLALRLLMEEGQTFEDFGEIYIHYMDNVIEMVKFHAPETYGEVLKQHGQLITEYAREHKEPNETDMEFAMRMHDQRLAKVQHLYRTITPVEIPEEAVAEAAAEVPQEFIPAGELADVEIDQIGNEPAVKDVN